MKKESAGQYRYTIGVGKFIYKLLAIIWRMPYVAYHGLKGLKSISGNRNISWGSLLEDIARRSPDNTAVKWCTCKLNAPDAMYQDIMEGKYKI